MTETSIRDTLFNAFNTLNTFSGIELINGNVAYPNKDFTPPENKRWFELFFNADAPSPVATFSEAQNRWAGFLQINICTPLDKGENEPDNKYSWISKLFSRGATFDDVEINKCYIASVGSQGDYYRTVVRVEWTADIDKQ